MTQTRVARYVTPTNKARALVMRGIPFKVTQDEIKLFFYGFGQVHRNDIIIEEKEYGKRTGVALVFFES